MILVLSHLQLSDGNNNDFIYRIFYSNVFYTKTVSDFWNKIWYRFSWLTNFINREIKYLQPFCALCLMFTRTVFPRKTITHKVEKGETITEIAQKYKITLWYLSIKPRCTKWFKTNTILILVSEVKLVVKINESSKKLTHLVLPRNFIWYWK
jgi:hypothetical protein